MSNDSATVVPQGEARYPKSGAVIRLDITTSSQRFEVPSAFAGMQCRWTFYPDTDNDERCDVVFGGSAVSVTINQDSSVASEAITINAASGETLLEQVPASFPMPPAGSTDTHFAAIGSAAGKLVIARG